VLASPKGGLLTVREAARVLRVSTATVYKLCALGELAHVRVLNVIRIPERVLGLMARRPRAPASGRARR
jgi:excisionase family DNA binding protein